MSSSRSRPVIFTDQSVRSARAGRKTNTRRVLKEPPLLHNLAGLVHHYGYHPNHGWAGFTVGLARTTPWFKCPYGVVGDTLWVREVWSPDHRTVYPCPSYVYRADFTHSLESDAWFEYQRKMHTVRCRELQGSMEHDANCLACVGFRWRSPRFMPKVASRLSLRLTAIRIERLQAISFADILAEGIELPAPRDEMVAPEAWARREWALGWDAINGKRAPHATNPWVWAYTFEVLP